MVRVADRNGMRWDFVGAQRSGLSGGRQGEELSEKRAPDDPAGRLNVKTAVETGVIAGRPGVHWCLSGEDNGLIGMKDEARAAGGEPVDIRLGGAEKTALLRYERFAKTAAGWRDECERDEFVRIEREELHARGGDRVPEKNTYGG
jgi:hypothetical protein